MVRSSEEDGPDLESLWAVWMRSLHEGLARMGFARPSLGFETEGTSLVGVQVCKLSGRLAVRRCSTVVRYFDQVRTPRYPCALQHAATGEIVPTLHVSR